MLLCVWHSYYPHGYFSFFGESDFTLHSGYTSLTSSFLRCLSAIEAVLMMLTTMFSHDLGAFECCGIAISIRPSRPSLQEHFCRTTQRRFRFYFDTQYGLLHFRGEYTVGEKKQINFCGQNRPIRGGRRQIYAAIDRTQAYTRVDQSRQSRVRHATVELEGLTRAVLGGENTSGLESELCACVFRGCLQFG